MSYFKEIDAWLDDVFADIAEHPDDKDLQVLAKQKIKEELLKSYRAGQKAGPQTEPKTAEQDTLASREVKKRQSWRKR